MATATAPTSPLVEPEAFGPRRIALRITAEEFGRMIDRDVFDARRRIELWDGELVETMPKNQPHQFALIQLTRLLLRLAPDDWTVSPEGSIALDETRVPIPDLAVLRGGPREYQSRRPTAPDAAILVEIADTSIRKDLGPTLTAYAAASISVYWVVNLNARRVEVYDNPTVTADGASYAERREYGPDDEVPVVLDGAEVGRVAVKDILP